MIEAAAAAVLVALRVARGSSSWLVLVLLLAVALNGLKWAFILMYVNKHYINVIIYIINR